MSCPKRPFDSEVNFVHGTSSRRHCFLYHLGDSFFFCLSAFIVLSKTRTMYVFFKVYLVDTLKRWLFIVYSNFFSKTLNCWNPSLYITCDHGLISCPARRQYIRGRGHFYELLIKKYRMVQRLREPDLLPC